MKLRERARDGYCTISGIWSLRLSVQLLFCLILYVDCCSYLTVPSQLSLFVLFIFCTGNSFHLFYSSLFFIIPHSLFPLCFSVPLAFSALSDQIGLSVSLLSFLANTPSTCSLPCDTWHSALVMICDKVAQWGVGTALHLNAMGDSERQRKQKHPTLNHGSTSHLLLT